MLALALLPLRGLQADPLDNWHWLYPSSTANQISAICAGGGAFVAVGGYGTILNSSDGKTWSSANSESLQNLWGVTFGTGMFVAVGDAGTLLTSTNSEDWSLQAGISSTNYFNGVSFGGGTFAAFTTFTVFLSTNGLGWTAVTPGFDIESMVYGDGVFEVSGDGPDTGEFFYSPDGINWNAANEEGSLTNTGTGGLLFYVDGYFADSLANAISTNGIDWTSQNYPAINSFLVYANGEIVIPSDGFTYTSTNFSTWSVHSSNLATGGPGAYATDMFVTYGNLTNDYSSSPPHLLYSTNAINWYSADSDSRNDLRAVTCYNCTMIAGGAGGVFLTSTNGQAWIESGYGAPVPPSDNVVSDLAVEDGIAVAVDWSDIDETVSLVSTNGTNWTSSVADSQAVYGFYPKIAFGNGIFVAADGVIETSTNDVQWFGIPNYSYIVDVAFGNGLFVGVGYESSVGEIVTSTDGSEWQAQNSQTDENLYAVAYGNGEWLVLGESGTVSTSLDGTNWSTTEYGGPSFGSSTFSVE